MNGITAGRYVYDAFGNVDITDTEYQFPFRFTGQKLDPETGLYYYKARYYDPALGRFLQVDPIGYEDQQNLYAYVANDPINLIDPTGMFLEPGDRFPTEEEAARDAVAEINPTSIAENREYGGAINREVTTIENPDGTTSEQVQYYATDPVSGDGDSVDIAASRSNTVGDYHTHGDYSKVGPDGEPVRSTRSQDEYGSDNFSRNDRSNSRTLAGATSAARSKYGETYRSYLGTPSGEVKTYTPPQ